MVQNDLKFFTNEPERDLYSRFAAILKSNTQFFDVLVGYFRTSGFFRIYPSLKNVEKIRILVGLNVDRFTLKIPEGWVGDRFTSKSGHELVEVKIPNADRNDKSPWPSFVTDPKRLHKNKFGTGLWMKLPKNAHTTLKRRERIGVDVSGKGIYEDRMSSVPNTELKSMADAARRSSQMDRRPTERHAQQENNPADRHVQQVSEMAAVQQEDLPDFLREPVRTR